jgi:uncharacterized protein YjiS (DUF1127 family)
MKPLRNHPMSDLMTTCFVQVRPTADRTKGRRLLRLLGMVLRIYLTRRALLELTPRERADIGISSSAALAEAARLPWDIAPDPHKPAGGIAWVFQSALQRARTRRLISRLDARELRDIGMSPSDAQAEASKAFWLR